MAWSDQLFRYCERGADPAFWAEPINAATNLAFIVAAAAAVCWHAPLKDQWRAPELVLVALVVVIGLGSFLFHTFATAWASLADVGPIGLFMLIYFGYALRRFAGLNWPAVAVGVAAFVAALWLAGEVTCRPSFLPVSNGLGLACLNGTVGYVPALIAMLGIGGALFWQGHGAAAALLCAGAVFAVSMVFRTLDFEVCTATTVSGVRIGTHFLWHLLNAVVLYLLLRAALLHGHARSAQ